MSGGGATNKIPLEGRVRLPSKVTEVIQDAATVATQIVKSSRSTELLGTTIKNFVLQGDAAIDNCSSNIRRLSVLVSHLTVQADNVEKSVQVISDVQEQLQFIEKKKYWSDDERNGQQQ